MDNLKAAVWARDIRIANMPAPNEDGAKPTICRDCGSTFWQWFRHYKDACPDCAATRAVAAAESMRSRSGYMYERWLVKQFRQLEAEMRRLGLSTAGPLGDPDSRET